MSKRLLSVMLILITMGLSASYANEPIKVVATTSHIADMLKVLAKDKLAIESLMGPGVDPHLYKASEHDVRALSQAQAVFYHGLFLEAKMTEIFDYLKSSKRVVALADQLPLEKLLADVHYPDIKDPHVWFDIQLWIQVFEHLRDQVIELDPQHQDYYMRQAEEYIQQLEELHRYVLQRINEVPLEQRVLITAHDAFRYFGQAYGFEVIGLQGVSTESEAGAKDVSDLADLIVKRKIKAIFVESSVPERQIRAVVEAVQARGWQVAIGGELFSDSLGTANTPEGTYIGMFKHNINTIVEALK